MSRKITAESIRKAVAAGPNEKVGTLVWDGGKGSVTGFHVRVWPSGAATYGYYYRRPITGRGAWWKIGKHGQPWSAESARREAKRLQGLVASGRDPAEEREKAKAAKAAAETIADLSKRWLEHLDHLAAIGQRSARTVVEYRRHVEHHISPTLGPVAAVDLTAQMVQKLHHDLRKRPTEANRVLASLSALLSWGRVEPNPVRHVERYDENRRTRHLTDAELANLGKALRDAAPEHTKRAALTQLELRTLPKNAPLALSPIVAAFLRLLLLTGARPGELLPLTWEQVDHAAGFLRIAKTKGGRTDPRAQSGVVISPPVAEVLAALEKIRAEGNPHVFPGSRRGSHLTEYGDAWYALLKAAGIKVHKTTTPGGRVLIDVVPYTARHTVGTTGAGLLPMKLVANVLGHAIASTTERYSHRDETATTRAATTVAATIASKLAGKNVTG